MAEEDEDAAAVADGVADPHALAARGGTETALSAEAVTVRPFTVAVRTSSVTRARTRRRRRAAGRGRGTGGERAGRARTAEPSARTSASRRRTCVHRAEESEEARNVRPRTTLAPWTIW